MTPVFNYDTRVFGKDIQSAIINHLHNESRYNREVAELYLAPEMYSGLLKDAHSIDPSATLITIYGPMGLTKILPSPYYHKIKLIKELLND